MNTKSQVRQGVHYGHVNLSSVHTFKKMEHSVTQRHMLNAIWSASLAYMTFNHVNNELCSKALGLSLVRHQLPASSYKASTVACLVSDQRFAVLRLQCSWSLAAVCKLALPDLLLLC